MIDRWSSQIALRKGSNEIFQGKARKLDDQMLANPERAASYGLRIMPTNLHFGFLYKETIITRDLSSFT